MTLSGEAYFEVKRNEQAPFSVILSESRVEVLGTSFSIAEQPEQKRLVVNVQSGKVRLSNADDSVDLSKNEQGIHYFEANRLEKSPINAQNEIVWKTGRFVFQEQKLKEILVTIEKTFNVSIEVRNGTLEDCQLSAIINQTSLQETLDKIASALKMDVETINSTNYVLANGVCQ